ncbi:MurR/RpiR family transcriptional regulator [Pokkaliibacter plantistimulans]|nr:MurR/RpiR family transcriptional regulator [Pokkaliibacter plantistimulans]
MSDYQDLQKAMKRVLPQLPPALQAVAAYFLEHPGKVATLSMRQVAAETGISAGNFPRLAKALGFDTYNDLRRVYSERVQDNGIGDYHLRAGALRDVAVDEGQAQVWSDFREAAHRNVDALFSSNALSRIVQVAEQLSAARTVYLVGMQASLSSAIYAKYLGSMLSERFRIVSGMGGIFADDITDLGEQDVLLAISLRPCSEYSIRIAQAAKARGARVIGCTDSDASPLALIADEVLQVPVKTPLFFDSYLAVTLLLELLLGFMTLQQGDVVERIESIEASRVALGEYWNNKEY